MYNEEGNPWGIDPNRILMYGSLSIRSSFSILDFSEVPDIDLSDPGLEDKNDNQISYSSEVCQYSVCPVNLNKEWINLVMPWPVILTKIIPCLMKRCHSNILIDADEVDEVLQYTKQLIFRIENCFTFDGVVTFHIRIMTHITIQQGLF